MKARRHDELQQVLQSADFQQWWNALRAAHDRLAASQKAYEDVQEQHNLTGFRAENAQKRAVDHLYRAGEYEDRAATRLAESNSLDNQSFESVAAFETQRVTTSDAWSNHLAAEHRVESLRSQIAALEAEADSKPAARNELKRLQPELRRLETEAETARHDYEKQAVEKNRLWREVERLWEASLQISLSVSELRRKAVRIRKESEKLFREAEAHRQKAEELRKAVKTAEHDLNDAEIEIRRVLRSASERFDCLAEEEFLYFPVKDSQRMVYCVPLFSDSAHYNIEVRALNIYEVDRQRGVDFIEPVGREPDDSADTRIDDFFLKERKSAPAGAT
ncbi:MAG: hypothetical protein GMKNLPBB_01669 [Myxococcota bacterium]|nr:hypothetical protein [Myxococcota bacterium]